MELRLDDELTAFLSGIDVVVPEQHQYLAFNPLLVGIPPPSRMIPDIWLGILELRTDYIMLYMGTGYDPGGLVYSHSTQQVCCYLADPYDEPEELLWFDLHHVLETYWDCIESGKFVIDVEYPGFGWSDGLTTQGWRLEEWTSLELEGALEVWHRLVDTITKRLPGTQGIDDRVTEQNEKEGDVDSFLISSEILEQYPAIPSFARAFLSRAKKPTFTSIAPQLDVPNEAFIHRIGAKLQELYPSTSLTTPQHEIDYHLNFLLFPWRTQGFQFVSQSDRDQWQNRRKRTLVFDNRAGLYLTPDETHSHSVSLILPFPLGANGHVRKNDGTTVERESQGHDVLYRHEQCCPVLPAHNPPLAAVLANWWEQVENENWHVDANGVVGGEDVWREADREENAEDYQTEWSCF